MAKWTKRASLTGRVGYVWLIDGNRNTVAEMRETDADRIIACMEQRDALQKVCETYRAARTEAEFDAADVLCEAALKLCTVDGEEGSGT